MLKRIRFWFGVVQKAVRHWLDADAFIHAAALAFFTVFSVAPMVIIAVSVVGTALGEDAAQGLVARELEQVIGEQAASAVQTAVEASRIERSGILPTVVGVATLILGATTVFAQMQRSLNQIWGVTPKPTRNSLLVLLKARLLSLTIVLAIGFVLLVSLLLSVALRSIIAFAREWLPLPPGVVVGTEIIVSLAVVTLLFAMIFRILPDVILGWRDVLVGAFVTALLFTVGRSLIAMYLAYTATASTYGAAGSLVLLLLWVNYSSLILLFGAAFTRAQREARGGEIRPRNTAVRVHTELVEEPASDAGRPSGLG